MIKPLFEIVTTTTGAVSIKNNVVGEIMHNPVGPWLEANSLYIEQSGLKQRLSENFDEELVIFDVGLGAAANSLAVLHCASQTVRPIRLVSFEKDLTLLEFALAHSDQFEHFQGYEEAIQTLLIKNHWSKGNITWELRHGDFLHFIERENSRAHLVFFDPYSPQMNREMWGASCFEKVYKKCAENAVLFTYSRATPIRVALLASGFYVGSGMATGLKDETTQAAVRRDDLRSPLAERWLTRWKKSSTPFPFDCEVQAQALVRGKILTHPQFL